MIEKAIFQRILVIRTIGISYGVQHQYAIYIYEKHSFINVNLVPQDKICRSCLKEGHSQELQ